MISDDEFEKIEEAAARIAQGMQTAPSMHIGPSAECARRTREDLEALTQLVPEASRTAEFALALIEGYVKAIKVERVTVRDCTFYGGMRDAIAAKEA